MWDFEFSCFMRVGMLMEMVIFSDILSNNPLLYPKSNARE